MTSGVDSPEGAGILGGRGAPMLLAVGGCHRDLIGRTDQPFEPGTSCPGRLAERAGGVARNVAVLLASAAPAVAIHLATRLGADAAGDALLADLAARGVGTDGVVRDGTAATGTYVALHGSDGELVAALSDLRIYDRLSPDQMAALAAPLAAADVVFADANLPAATLAVLSESVGARLAVDAVSRAKAGRVLAPAQAGALLFINRASAEAIAGRALPSADAAARSLRTIGVRRAVVTAGAGPVAVLDGGDPRLLPVPAMPVADVTGAGDALIAGTLLALAFGRSLVEAAEIGILAAGAALSCTGALARLPAAVLHRAGAIPTNPGAFCDQVARPDR